MIRTVKKPIDKTIVKHVAVSYEDKYNFRSKGKIYLIVSNLRTKTIKYIADDLSIRSGPKSGFKLLDKKYIKAAVEKFNKEV